MESRESMKKLLDQLSRSFSLGEKEEDAYNEESFAPRNNAISSLVEIDTAL